MSPGKTLVILFLTLGAFAALAAPPPDGFGPPPGGPPPPPPRLDELYPPDQILQNQVALDLTDDQLAVLKRLLMETHNSTLDIQFALQRAAEGLHAALAVPHVHERDALAAADKVMQLETAMKKAHLTLMIRVKNLLTLDQQRKLDAMRRPGGPAPAREN